LRHSRRGSMRTEGSHCGRQKLLRELLRWAAKASTTSTTNAPNATRILNVRRFAASVHCCVPALRTGRRRPVARCGVGPWSAPLCRTESHRRGRRSAALRLSTAAPHFRRHVRCSRAFGRCPIGGSRAVDHPSDPMRYPRAAQIITVIRVSEPIDVGRCRALLAQRSWNMFIDKPPGFPIWRIGRRVTASTGPS
jgi:hypothetical protein